METRNEEIIKYANERLEYMCKDNNIAYVDISLLNRYINSGIYPTNDGYNYISAQIVTLLNSKNSI